MTRQPHRRQVVVVGGGPAGLMLGYLLARAGIRVTVLEKHSDFLRDFRGDTIHPSTLRMFSELGLLERFLERPHDQVRSLSVSMNGRSFRFADFSHLPHAYNFIAMMPQWEFLDFLADQARTYPEFELMMEVEGYDLMRDDNDRVTGVLARARDGRTLSLEADLVVAADGRRSILRGAAGLTVTDIGAPIDVLWFRLPRRPGDTAETGGYLSAGHMLVAINRRSYWQCAFVIEKDGLERLKAAGIETFRQTVAQLFPAVADRVDEIADWDWVKLLSVKVDRLETWAQDGLLCIGDAAHAMSPVGGVGVNLAIQDAVASANLLWEVLRAGRPGLDDLAGVQARREWPTKVTQWGQVLIQERFIKAVIEDGHYDEAPWPLRMFDGMSVLRRLPASAVGMGVRPEHIRSPDMHKLPGPLG